MIDSLPFRSTRTRPDISADMALLARYSSDPRRTHALSVKRVPRHLQGTWEFAMRIENKDAQRCCWNSCPL